MEQVTMTFLRDPNQETYQVWIEDMDPYYATVRYVHSGKEELVDLCDVIFNTTIACESLFPR